MKKNVSLVLVVAASVLISSCASMFIPKNEKITFNTGNSKTEVYVEKVLIGKGKTFTTKVNKKDGSSLDVVLRTEGYKDQHFAMIKTHRPPAYYPLMVLNIFNLYGLYMDPLFGGEKLKSFDKVITFNSKKGESKLVNKKKTDKYLNISTISLNIEDSDKDLRTIRVPYDKTDQFKAIKVADKKDKTSRAKVDAKAAKKQRKKGVKKTLDGDKDKDVRLEDTKFSANLYETLKKTGFIDTINKVFLDNNNTLVLEASITKISTYKITNRWASYNKAKVSLTWYIKNMYEEIIDSVETTEFSGDFASVYSYYSMNTKKWGNMVGDAIDISYLKLQKNKTLLKHLKINKDFKIKDKKLRLPKPSASSIIRDKSDASEASVIVKTKENGKDSGHGSGFAISKNGYILTNYHVIAGKTVKKPKDITIITASGKEFPGKLVRSNKFRDVALIKIDGSFEKVFKLNSKRKFKNLDDVYTIGAPKSVELGQSVSVGIISNVREYNDNPLLQLGMSVNAGNSGGPVFDSKGTLHGIIKSKLVGYSTEGVSFAVPAHLVLSYLNMRY